MTAHPPCKPIVTRSAVGMWTISLLELALGVLRIERRDAVQGGMLRRWLEDQVLTRFQERALPVDAEGPADAPACTSPIPAPTATR